MHFLATGAQTPTGRSISLSVIPTTGNTLEKLFRSRWECRWAKRRVIYHSRILLRALGFRPGVLIHRLEAYATDRQLDAMAVRLTWSPPTVAIIKIPFAHCEGMTWTSSRCSKRISYIVALSCLPITVPLPTDRWRTGVHVGVLLHTGPMARTKFRRPAKSQLG